MSICIKCGNFYLSDPETDDELCFNCEMEEKEERIAELEKENKTLHKELELLIENIELESCIYCPCAIDFNKKHQREIEFTCSCENRDGCKECFENIKNYFIQQAKESLKNEN